MDGETALNKIGVGSSIIVFGFAIGAVLQYLMKVVLARFLGPESYGVFVQGLSISAATATIALFGFHMSIPRFMSYYRGKKEESLIENSVVTSFYIVVPFSLLLSALLYFLSGWLSVSVFNEPSLTVPLKFFSLTVLPLSLFYFTIALMRGMQNAKYKILLDDVLFSGTELLLIAVFLVAGYELSGAIYAYIISLGIVLLACYYLYRKVADRGIFSASELVPRKLLSFSWPLFIISVLLLSNKWSDIIMLGWLTESIEVGIYDVAFAIAGILTFLLSSLNYMFMPVVSEMYGKGNLSQIMEVYSTSTRWIVAATLPIVAGMLVFPEEMLETLFGASYMVGATSLSVLALGFFYHIAVGPAGMILLSIGKTKQFMIGTAVITVFDLVLNFLLIPTYGMLGAAIATTLGFVAGNTVYLIFVKRELGGLPYDWGYYKPIFSAFFASAAVYILKIMFSPALVASVMLGVILVAMYIFILYIVGGVQEEDYALVKELTPSL